MNFDPLTVLVLIDLQKGFEGNEDYWGGNRNHPKLEDNVMALLQYWREKGRPVAHVMHASTNPNSPLAPNNPGHALMDAFTPQGDEPLFVKNVNSAFIGTDLQKWLDERGIKKVVMVGMTTNHCVSTSVRMAANFGYETYAVEDCIATFDRVDHNGNRFPAQQIHDISLASLHEEFATIIDTKTALNH